MDGRFITEARTAAVSAVSVKHPGATRRGTAGDHRLWRAGAQPSRGDRHRPEAPRDPSVESEPREPHVPSRERCVRAATAAITVAASARDAVDGADLSCWRPRRASRSCRGEWIAPARTSARSAHAGRISARWTPRWSRARRVRRFADRRACGGWRHRAADEGGRVRRTSIWRENWGKSFAEELPAERRRTKSRSSSRSGWRWKMWRPRTSPIMKAAERGLGRGFVL